MCLLTYLLTYLLSDTTLHQVYLLLCCERVDASFLGFITGPTVVQGLLKLRRPRRSHPIG